MQGNRDALALVRVPTEAEEQLRAIHRQREQLVKARKVLEAQGRSLMVNHGIEPVKSWWKKRTFAALQVPQWMKELLNNSQPILLALEEKIRALSVQLQAAASSAQPRGLGAMSSVVIDREIGNWERFKNRRQVGSYTGLCPGEYSSGKTRLQGCVTKHGNPRLQSRFGRDGLAPGAFSTQLQTGRKMAIDPVQGSARYRSRAQESHRRGGPSTGRRSVAHSHRPTHSRATWIKYLIHEFEGNRKEDTPITRLY